MEKPEKLKAQLKSGRARHPPRRHCIANADAAHSVSIRAPAPSIPSANHGQPVLGILCGEAVQGLVEGGRQGQAGLRDYQTAIS